MVIIYGTRLYGTTHRCAGTHVSTRFFHIYWLPLIPLGSHLVLEQYEDGSFRGVPIGLSGRSVLAAYLRTWGVIAAIAGLAIIAGLSSVIEEEEATALIVPIAMTLFGLGGVLAAWLWIGRLSVEQRAQQMAYANFAGHPVDVAMLGDGRASVRMAVADAVVRRGQALASSGYRVMHNPETQWREIALEPQTQDPYYLTAALTLARIDASFAAGPERAQLESTHAAIWQKLRVAQPELLTHAHANV